MWWGRERITDKGKNVNLAGLHDGPQSGTAAAAEDVDHAFGKALDEELKGRPVAEDADTRQLEHHRVA